MAELTDDEIRERFLYHAPSDAGIERHARLSAAFVALAQLVRDTVPDGRERSLALTKLEESKFWSSAGVARNPQTR